MRELKGQGQGQTVVLSAIPVRRWLRLHPHLTREKDVVVPNCFPAVRAMLDADLPSCDEIKSNSRRGTVRSLQKS